MPSMVVFEPTMRCNLECHFCFQNEVRSRLARDLTLDQIRQIIDHLAPEIRHVRLIGGEIFAYKPILDVLELLAEKRMTFGFTTNATLIDPKKIERLARFKGVVNNIGVSIDGPEDVHDRIRGRGSYRKAVDAMRMLSPHFRVQVNMVVLSENMTLAGAAMEALRREAGIHYMSFQFIQYSTATELDETRRRFGDPGLQLDASVVAEGTKRRESPDEIRRFMSDLRAQARRLGIGIHFEPRMAERHLDEFWEERLDASDVPLTCSGLGVPRINYRGELNLCTYIRPVLGSLLTHHLRDLWNGDAMRRHRRVLMASRQMVPLCKRCCRAAPSTGKSDRESAYARND